MNVPSAAAPASSSMISAGAGFAAAMSSLRVSVSRTGLRTASAAPATSGSSSENLPPNDPPSAVPRTRTRSTGRPNSFES